MKKVRFETPNKLLQMNDSECHSPRPFVEQKSETKTPYLNYEYAKVLQFQSDPVHRYECSNSSPYPVVEQILPQHPFKSQARCLPSKDLEVSYFDSCVPVQGKYLKTNYPKASGLTNQVLSSTENYTLRIASDKDDSFFIKPEKSGKKNFNEVNPIYNSYKRSSFDKENEPQFKKAEIMSNSNPICNSNKGFNFNKERWIDKKVEIFNNVAGNPALRQMLPENKVEAYFNTNIVSDDMCNCHHCCRQLKKLESNTVNRCYHVPSDCTVTKHSGVNCVREGKIYQANHFQNAKCCYDNSGNVTVSNSNFLQAVDRESWEIDKYKACKNSHATDIITQTNIKEKREPTVSDLFKIIKLQNEQLQLLQEKVDKFILSSKQSIPTEKLLDKSRQEQISLQSLDSKVSIGVMTSFEMVRTSTIINKEVVTQRIDNQIQCNRSEISIKEVVSKSQKGNENFLDGIRPVSKESQMNSHNINNCLNAETNGETSLQHYPTENLNDEKTLNEISLFNVQVDNATTPYMSPEQSLYLDIRDYSDSESSSDDQSNVGWTYYNKVMNHVNGMLQDTDMPSSASALQRKTRQCVQMQIDKTNVSVTKRVKFGDDPLGVLQPHIYTASDTSLKMNELAAKYLKNGLRPAVMSSTRKPIMGPGDLSFATKNYMERHKLLQGAAVAGQSSDAMPRFLDITALKQQPKLL